MTAFEKWVEHAVLLIIKTTEDFRARAPKNLTALPMERHAHQRYVTSFVLIKAERNKVPFADLAPADQERLVEKALVRLVSEFRIESYDIGRPDGPAYRTLPALVALAKVATISTD